MDHETLDEARQWLARTGFTDDLAAADGSLHGQPSGRNFPPTDLVIAATYRFERPGEPDVEDVLFALATPEGEPVGTFTVAQGQGVSPDDEELVRALHESTPQVEGARKRTTHDHIPAVFPSREAAEAAVAELRESGFGSEHLGVAIHGPSDVVFEHDEEAELARDIGVGAAAGAPTGVIGGLAVAAVALPGFGTLGVAGLFAVAAASGFGGAFLGGLLGIVAADRALTEHDELSHTPLQSGEVLVVVCGHGRAQTVESIMLRNGGRLLSHSSVHH